MKEEKLFSNLIGIFAYDTGSTDSGIKNEILRQEIKEHLKKLNDTEFRIIMSNFIRKHFVSKKAISLKYGIEDVKIFITWLSEYMEIDI